MRNKVFMTLQLFAEPAPDGPKPDGPKPDVPKPGDPKPSDPAPDPKYSPGEVERIVSQRLTEWEKKQQQKADEATKLSEMNDQQKAEYERDQLQKRLDELEKKNAIAQMMTTARKMVMDEGIHIPDELLGRLVSTDAKETKSAVDGFVKLFKEAVQAAVKDALRGEPPKASGTASTITKEQIMAVADRRERQRLISENQHLFTGGR